MVLRAAERQGFRDGAPRCADRPPLACLQHSRKLRASGIPGEHRVPAALARTLGKRVFAEHTGN